MLMNSLKTVIIIASMLALLSCDNNTDIEETSIARAPYKVYITVINNSTDNISYERKLEYCELTFNNNDTKYESPECSYVIDSMAPKTPEEITPFMIDYWKTDIPTIDVATLEPSKSATSYAVGGAVGRSSAEGNYGYMISFHSPVIIITIDNAIRKIIGYPEDLYRKFYTDKPEEFFDNISFYGMFYGAQLNEMTLDFKYNPCGLTSHTALTNYSQFARNARVYINITVNSIDDIKVELDKKTIVSDSGYDATTNTCKFYEDEEELDEEPDHNAWPSIRAAYHFENFPDNLIGRRYILIKPNTSNFIRYGADPE